MKKVKEFNEFVNESKAEDVFKEVLEVEVFRAVNDNWEYWVNIFIPDFNGNHDDLNRYLIERMGDDIYENRREPEFLLELSQQVYLDADDEFEDHIERFLKKEYGKVDDYTVRGKIAPSEEQYRHMDRLLVEVVEEISKR